MLGDRERTTAAGVCSAGGRTHTWSVTLEQHKDDARTKASRTDRKRREITPLEKYVMAVVVLSVLVPMVALYFLPLASG